MNELRSQYNNCKNKSNEDFYYKNDDDKNKIIKNEIDFHDGSNNKFLFKNQKYSTFTPLASENRLSDSSSSSHFNNNGQHQSSKSKTWPEKELKLVNNNSFESQLKYEKDEYLDELHYSKSMNKSTLVNNRKVSHTESFDSAKSNFKEDTYSSNFSMQARGKIFEVSKSERNYSSCRLIYFSLKKIQRMKIL